MKVAITGANGNLGRRLTAQLRGDHEVRAIVRSARARDQMVKQFGDSLDICVVDYGDTEGLTSALEGVDRAVHLVGIIKETAANPFSVAHERACTALARASEAAGVGGIVHLSIVGASPSSANACLMSRGQADEILLAGKVRSTVIRVPMVLGEGDYASFALLKQARSKFVVAFRPSSLEQPIYAGDVIAALTAAMTGEHPGIFELAGPESLPRRELIRRAAGVLGVPGPAIFPLPVSLGMFIASLVEKSSNPPVTRAMLGVLDHDDRVDVTAACQALGITLTPLDETIRQIA